MAKNARKRKNPVDRKPVFLLVRVVKINIYKELSRFNFKKVNERLSYALLTTNFSASFPVMSWLKIGTERQSADDFLCCVKVFFDMVYNDKLYVVVADCVRLSVRYGLIQSCGNPSYAYTLKPLCNIQNVTNRIYFVT